MAALARAAAFALAKPAGKVGAPAAPPGGPLAHWWRRAAHILLASKIRG